MTRPFGGDHLAFEYPPCTDDAKEAQERVRGIVEAARTEKRAVKQRLESSKEHRVEAVERLTSELAESPAMKQLRAWLFKNQDVGHVHVSLESDVFEPGNEALYRDLLLKILSSAAAGTEEIRRAEDRKAELRRDRVVMSDKLAPWPEDKINENALNEGKIGANKDVLHEYNREVGATSGWNAATLRASLVGAGCRVEDVPPGGFEVFWPADAVEGKAELICQAFAGSAGLVPSSERFVKVKRGFQGAPAAVERRKNYVDDANGVPTRRFVTRAVSHYHIAEMLGIPFVQGKPTVVDGPGRTPGHYPRGESMKFADQLKTFDGTSAAVVKPGNWPNYVDPTEPEPLTQTGLQGSRVSRANVDASTALDHNERSSMQVRNGSGSTQTMLSAAATQEPVDGNPAKIIRANKGERFDNTPEAVCILELDLALAAAQGIEFVNQHSNDSHEYKIAYDRWVQLFNGEFDEPDKANIKRTALKELDEYIYSAQKNREVTLNSVPNGIISRANFQPAQARWVDFPIKASGFVPWDDSVVAQLRDFFTVERLLDAKSAAEDEMKKNKAYT